VVSSETAAREPATRPAGAAGAAAIEA
jgi:hypothetical protein